MEQQAPRVICKNPTKLIEILGNIEQWHDRCVIFAAEPWTLESSAVVVWSYADERIDRMPMSIEVDGCHYAYFIETFIPKEFLSGWFDHPPTAEEKAQRIIDYAINDS